MDEQDYDMVRDFAASVGLDISNYDVVKSENSYLLNQGDAPDYSPQIAGQFTDVVPREAFRGNGSYYQRVRTGRGGTKGGPNPGNLGRLVNRQTSQALKKVMVSCYVENYHKLGINVQTGALLESISSPNNIEEVGSDKAARFVFTIEDIPGIPRTGANRSIPKRFQNRPSTQYYGPRVFFGRAAIITPNSKMRFLNKSGDIVFKNVVRAAPAKNIFLLSGDQIDRLNMTILEPRSKELKKRIKAMLEDNNEADIDGD